MEKLKIIEELDNLNVTKIIIKNAKYVISTLDEKYCVRLKYDDIYSSSHGTIILDWIVKPDTIFSLEIGKRSCGYFIEKNGKLIKTEDDVYFKNNDTIGIINKDLVSFYTNKKKNEK